MTGVQTCALPIFQQVTKAGVFVGSNRLKHMVDAMAEMRRESEKDGGGTYIEFSKNRNGNVAVKLAYQLTGSNIIYSNVEPNKNEENEE